MKYSQRPKYERRNETIAVLVMILLCIPVLFIYFSFFANAFILDSTGELTLQNFQFLYQPIQLSQYTVEPIGKAFRNTVIFTAIATTLEVTISCMAGYALARMEFTGITFAGAGQNLDTGTKVVHNAPETTSYINTKSISKDGGISTFRSSVVVKNSAAKSKSAVSCQSLMLDDKSRSDTIPAMDIRTQDADIGHEAKIGRISDEAVFYLMSRGISEEDARAMIVSGFADNVSKELPLEYAVEMNNLIRLEMKGSIG